MNVAFRVALRVEGKWWVAYLAHMDTMVGAVEMARCLIGPAKDHKRAKKAFMDLAMIMVEIATRATGGEVESWNDPVPAPESERSGNA